MKLVTATVGPFKSIDQPQVVQIDPRVTVLVGMNEAGKTVFLQSLVKARDVLGRSLFDPVSDYPRRGLSEYLKRHGQNPERVVALTFQLSEAEVHRLNADLNTNLPAGFEFTLSYNYANTDRIAITVDERPMVAAFQAREGLSPEVYAALQKVQTLKAIPTALVDLSLNDVDSTLVADVRTMLEAVPPNWNGTGEFHAWSKLTPTVPKFHYFGDYELLPSKMNLADLARRVEQAKSDRSHLRSEHLGVLALLRMADIAIGDFSAPGGYEPLKARIEAISISLTDQIMEFWKQNENLEVEIDIKPDPDDEPPFNEGPNLYLRIRNRRHRGVSTPFQQRSRGFIWFFSFLVWFDEVKHQLASAGGDAKRELILLLDEPGLSLHALAQDDFLRYIDRLAERHQVLYTTHSPFMVRSDKLSRVRVVEDRVTEGTVISDNISQSDPRTIFPLQAALGWTIAQNLFISERNLLVEGPSDLVYLKQTSATLEAAGREGLRDDITIVPTGGLDKVATFVALLGANGLKLAVLHDFRGSPEQRLIDLVRAKMISPKAVLNTSQFRDVVNFGNDGAPSDTEDLFDPGLYLKYFNQAFKKGLAGRVVELGDLPNGDRIIDRIERFLASSGIQVRPSGGFNHYAVASEFASRPPKKLDADTLDRFEALFSAVNRLFS